MEGWHAHWSWADECGPGQFPEEAWWGMQRRLRVRQGRFLGTTTPYVFGWLYDLWDAWRRGEREDVEFISFPSKQNPGFPEEEFERARSTLPGWQFRMFYEAQWERPVGLCYQDIDETCWTNTLPDGWRDWPHYAGVDFGFTAPTAVVFAAYDEESDILWCYDEYVAEGKTHAENATAAKTLLRQCWGDPTSPEGVEEFAQRGWPFPRKDGIAHGGDKHDVTAGIGEVIERANTGRLRFYHPGLPQLKREMDGYVWDQKRPDTPVKKNDHLMDAMRYLCWGFRAKRTRGGARPRPQLLVLR